MPATVHDVAILSDFRYPGGTSASIAAEVHAQAEAALSTVLVHVPSPHQPGRCRSARGSATCSATASAELARADQPVSARLLLIRQPRIFTEDLKTRAPGARRPDGHGDQPAAGRRRRPVPVLRLRGGPRAGAPLLRRPRRVGPDQSAGPRAGAAGRAGRPAGRRGLARDHRRGALVARPGRLRRRRTGDRPARPGRPGEVAARARGDPAAPTPTPTTFGYACSAAARSRSSGSAGSRTTGTWSGSVPSCPTSSCAASTSSSTSTTRTWWRRSAGPSSRRWPAAYR